MQKHKRIKFLTSLSEPLAYGQIQSPVGKLGIFVSGQKLCGVLWDNDSFDCFLAEAKLNHDEANPVIVETKKQLVEYFQGKRKAFDLPVFTNGTKFQAKVWQELNKIPYGKTISYAEQANRIGDRKKARAVGVANGMNPISIIIPCHRVIGSNGKLTGFAGGLDKKEFLLRLEKDHSS